MCLCMSYIYKRFQPKAENVLISNIKPSKIIIVRGTLMRSIYERRQYSASSGAGYFIV